MNHLKTGNAFFAQGSYKAYKFLGKELQETGVYDLGARFYMADLGRFGTIDPKSPYTHETYSYAWNNPIRFADPTGLEGEPTNGDPGGPGSIGDAKNPINIQGVTITVYRPVALQPRGLDMSASTFASGAMMLGRFNLAGLAIAGIAAIILPKSPEIYHAIAAWKKEEITIDLSPKALPAHFAQGQDAEDEGTDVNGEEVPQDSVNESDQTGYESRKGGGKNGQHKNLKAKQSAGEKYEEAKKKLDSISRKPGKTKEDNQLKKQLEKQVKHWKAKAEETGENHSRNAKGNR